MEVALRKKRYGGWRNGLGQSGETDSEGSGLPGGVIDFSSGETDPSLYYDPPGYNITPTDQTLSDLEKQLIASGYGKSDTGAPSSLPSVETIAKAITAFAQIGVKALAPSAVTGACPVGYTLSGAACVPIAKTAGAPLLAGVPNSTLLMIGAGFLFLMVLSKGGGRR